MFREVRSFIYQKIQSDRVPLSIELIEQQVKYSDIFEDPEKQEEIPNLLAQLLQIRNDKTISNYPSTPQYGVGSAKDLQDLQECIDSFSLGK